MGAEAGLSIRLKGSGTSMIKRLRRLLQLSLIGCVSAIAAGCSPSSPNLMGNPAGKPFTTSMLAASGKPMVWDCSVVQMSSPPRYACSDNKTYTAFELRDIRLDNEAVVTTTPVFEPRHVPRQ